MKADTHIHTIASGHASGTIFQAATEGAKKGLELICITDHAPSMRGTTTVSYFSGIKNTPKVRSGVEILFGVELNILNESGLVDLPDNILAALDIAVASLHNKCFKPQNRETNTKTLINVMKNRKINIIGHPDDNLYPIDYDVFVKACGDYGVFPEVNNQSLKPDSYRKNARLNIIDMLAACVKYNVKISVGSDAHKTNEVGNFSEAEKLFEELNFPQSLIINNDLTAFKKQLLR